MPFSRRQIDLLEKSYNIETKIFYLENRTSLTYLLNAGKELKQTIREFKPDICHPHYGSVNSLFVALFCNKPIVITFHGSDLNKTPSDGFFADIMARIFSNLSALKAKSIIVVSENLKKQLWWAQKKATVIPVGTDSNEFYPIAKDEAMAELNQKLTYPTIVFNANNPLIKRLDIANKAIGIVKKEFANVHLYLLEGNVDPHKVKYILNAADVLLLCSDREGSPTIIKEAMACNLKIISTDVGDVKNRLSKVNEAIIVEQSPDSIAKGIIEILKKENLNYNGRDELMRQGLDENSLAEKITSLYDKLL